MTTPTPAPNSGDSIAGAVRDLASQINQAPYDYTPPQMTKGVISATALTATPPTVSITLSGASDVTDSVRFLESYSPVVGDTVAIAKTGPDLFILGAYADGASDWQTATLSSGFSQNGNSGGNVQYRLVWDHGSLKMQWKGVAGHTGTNTTVISGLGTSFRPSAVRPMTCARNSTGVNTVNVLFNTDGTVTLAGATVTGGTVTIPDHSHSGLTDYQLDGYLSQAGSNLIHAHGVFVTSFSPITVGGVSDPTWVSFNGVEYFL